MYAVKSEALQRDDEVWPEPAVLAENKLLSEWIDHRSYDLIEDYNATEDEIVLVYDAKHHPKPMVALDLSEAPLWAKVLINGMEIAKVNLPLTLADIRLLPI